MLPLNLLSLLTNWRVLAGLGFALALGFSLVQTARLHHAKSDLATARQALRNPVTHATWESEAKRDAVDLKTCRLNNATLSQAVTDQNAATEALRADTERRAKMLSDGLLQARKGRAGAEEEARRLLAGSAGFDSCSRAVEAREAVLRGLK